MNKTILHVINHTHWDREWFVPGTFSQKWIPQLIRNLETIVDNNKQYTFLLDAQTLVIEDLQAVDKVTYDAACHLIKNKQLAIGPYYAQIDMRISGAETLIRNLRIGIDKAKQLQSSENFTAWAVDIFGHVSQSPQIHTMFGIKNAFLWRGIPELNPFFWWNGPDGSKMLVVDLFAGGYRNFYKVDKEDTIALSRLKHEVEKLTHYYKNGHIPVFDGYDFDTEPGDSASYFKGRYGEYLEQNNIEVVQSSPDEFIKATLTSSSDFPSISGELISGKYASVFPGTLSTRTYTKLAGGQMEQLLYRYAEPLSLLLRRELYPTEIFEEQTKAILQNSVHDVTCGCSIDQVHEISELRCLKGYAKTKEVIENTLTSVAGSLKDGIYAYLPAPGEFNTKIFDSGSLYQVKGNGVSIVQIAEVTQLEKKNQTIDSFTWKNEHYEMTLKTDGSIEGALGIFGHLVARHEDGDTYWDEPRGDVANLKVDGPMIILYQTEHFAQVSFAASIKTDTYAVKADIFITFDDSALIKWKIKLNSTGKGYSLLFRNTYKEKLEKIQVGMQFDIVERDLEDHNLLGRDLPEEFDSILVGQRDMYRTFTFPFHSYISPVKNGTNVHVLAKGIKAYQTENLQHIDIVLNRSVDWLMKTGEHLYHSGDAGPKFYVPDARCQRETTIECAVFVSNFGPKDSEFYQTVDSFINPSLLFSVTGSNGDKTKLNIYKENVPFSSIHQYNGMSLARIYNPTAEIISLSEEYESTDPFGQTIGALTAINPHSIITLKLKDISKVSIYDQLPQIKMLNYPDYPVGPDKSKPDPKALEILLHMHEELSYKKADLQEQIKAAGNTVPSELMHQYYITARECLEAKLSYLWNKKRASRGDSITEEYVFEVDNNLYELALEYHNLRIMRRVYDYIVTINS